MTEFEGLVLRCLTNRLGRCVADIGPLVGRQPGADSNAQHSGAINRALMHLEKLGLVMRMDDKKPIAWMLPPVRDMRPVLAPATTLLFMGEP